MLCGWKHSPPVAGPAASSRQPLPNALQASRMRSRVNIGRALPHEAVVGFVPDASARISARLHREHAQVQLRSCFRGASDLLQTSHEVRPKAGHTRGQQTKKPESPYFRLSPAAVHSGEVKRQRESLWYTKVNARTPSRLTGRSSRPATAGGVSPVRDTRCIVADRAYAACLRGRLSSNVSRPPP